MEEKTSKTRRLRWTIGLMMLLIAVSAVVFSFFRPRDHRATVQRAIGVITDNHVTFDPSQYRVDAVTPSADRRYWRVVFAPVAGANVKKMSVTVVDRPWWTARTKVSLPVRSR